MIMLSSKISDIWPGYKSDREGGERTGGGMLGTGQAPNTASCTGKESKLHAKRQP